MTDTRYLTDGRRYLTTPQAASYCGFEPDAQLLAPPAERPAGERRPRAYQDRAVRSFHEWARRKRVTPLPGREGLWERSELDDALHRRTDDGARVSAIAERARADVRAFALKGGR